ncbi:NAD(P)-dependent oxidoreductase [Carnobacterium pleistocenium]|uniref:NAD(P)-dependent oxidoreductase n=1 Tax=Carnobacterium pleistocenium TaxID=181073 RepID=UPI000557725F|nr:NAD(P)-dependent oxidoreductase [Carnobacterium pleistocenium]
MKIGIIGATGKSGSKISAEALIRGHEVVPLVRNAAKLPDNEDIFYIEKDLYDLTYKDIENLDVVVDAFNAPVGKEELHQTSLDYIVSLVQGHETPRLIVVGGAGSLYVDDAMTTQLMDTPNFPEEAKPTAFNMGKALDRLKLVEDTNWTYISPSAFFNFKGSRTGKYQVGQDQLLTNSKGESEVSYADFALALVDEIENQQFINQRITICSE